MLLERLFFIFLFLFSIFLFISSFTLPLYSGTGVFGSGFFPRWISGILSILIGYYLIILMAKKMNEHKEKNNGSIIINQIILVISLFISFGLIYIIGLLPSASIFMLFILIAVQKIPWIKSIIFTILTICIIFGVFEFWLNVQFPKGIFG